MENSLINQIADIEAIKANLEQVVKASQATVTAVETTFKNAKLTFSETKNISNTLEQTANSLKNVKTQISDYEKAQQALAKQTIQVGVAHERINEVINREAKSIAELTAQNKVLESIRKHMNINDVEYANNQQKIIDAQNKNIEKIKEFQTAENQRISGIGKYEEAIRNALNIEGEYGMQLSLIKKTMAEVQAEIKSNGDATGELTKKYEELNKKSGEVLKKQKEMKGGIRYLADEYGKFKAVLQGMQAAMGVVSVFSGFTSLLGIHSQAVEKVTAKMTALMATMQGLKSIQELLNKNNYFMQFIKNTPILMRSFTAVSGAIKGFVGAIGGFGVLAGVGAIVAGFALGIKKLSDTVKFANTDLKEFAKNLDDLNKILTENIDKKAIEVRAEIYSEYAKGLITSAQALERYADVANEAGRRLESENLTKIQETILKLEKEQQNIDNLRADARKGGVTSSFQLTKALEREKEIEVELMNARALELAILNDQKKSSLEFKQILTKENTELKNLTEIYENRAIKAQQAFSKETEKLREQLNKGTISIEDYEKKYLDLAFTFQKNELEIKLKELPKLADLADTEDDFKKFQAEILKTETELNNLNFDNFVKKLKEADENLLKLTKNFETRAIKAQGKFADEIERLRDKLYNGGLSVEDFENQLLELTNKFEKTELEIKISELVELSGLQKAGDAFEKTQAEIRKLQQELNNLNFETFVNNTDNAEKILLKLTKTLEKNASIAQKAFNKDVENLRKQLYNGTISLKEYENQYLKLAFTFQKNELEIKLKELKEIINTQQTKEGFDVIQNEIDLTQKALDDLNFDEFNKNLSKLEVTFSDKLASIGEIFGSFSQMLSSISTSIFNNQIADIDRFDERNEKSFEQRRLYIVETVVNEEDRVKAITALEKERQSAEAEITRQRAEVEARKAKFDVAIVTTQALATSAGAIASAIASATAGDPYTVAARIAAALAAAIAGVVAVASALQKVGNIPTYETGGLTPVNKPFIAGERGYEVGIGDSGKPYIFENKGVYQTNERVKIFTHEKSKKMVESQTITNNNNKDVYFRNEFAIKVIDNQRIKKYFKV